MNYRYWLRRGIGVKRWILLVSGGAVLAAVGFLALVGRDLVALIDGSLPAAGGSGALAA